jgi:hypothetical protein
MPTKPKAAEPETVRDLIDAISAGNEDAKAQLLAHMAHVARRERLAGYEDGLRAGGE